MVGVDVHVRSLQRLEVVLYLRKVDDARTLYLLSGHGYDGVAYVSRGRVVKPTLFGDVLPVPLLVHHRRIGTLVVMYELDLIMFGIVIVPRILSTLDDQCVCLHGDGLVGVGIVIGRTALVCYGGRLRVLGPRIDHRVRLVIACDVLPGVEVHRYVLSRSRKCPVDIGLVCELGLARCDRPLVEQIASETLRQYGEYDRHGRDLACRYVHDIHLMLR